MSRARLPQQNERLLRALTEGSVTFAVIGGVAALLHGASLMTVDLDVAAPFDEDNLSRLRAALVQPLGDFRSLHTIEMEVYGINAKVLARDDLIRVKRTVARPKDIAVALELEAAREREESG